MVVLEPHKAYEAYAGEPLPLKREYPDEEQSGVDFGMKIAGLLLVVLVLVFGAGASIYPGPLWQAILILFAIALLGGALIFYSSKVGAWQKRREWEKSFQINNADLQIDYKAVRKVINHLKEHTRYVCLSFEEVVVHLACGLRQKEIFTTFTWEVFENYQFFTGQRADCPRTYCPK